MYRSANPFVRLGRYFEYVSYAEGTSTHRATPRRTAHFFRGQARNRSEEPVQTHLPLIFLLAKEDCNSNPESEDLQMPSEMIVMNKDFTCKREYGVHRADDASAFDARGALVISAAVGDGTPSRCPNRYPDVNIIQEALNTFSPAEGGPDTPLVIDGICGSKTRRAIVRFQVKWDIANRWNTYDGIVDPGGPTIAALSKTGKYRIHPAKDFLELAPG